MNKKDYFDVILPNVNVSMDMLKELRNDYPHLDFLLVNTPVGEGLRIKGMTTTDEIAKIKKIVKGE